MSNRLRNFFRLAFATTFTATGTVLFGLTLALDTWKTRQFAGRSITQGILNECTKVNETGKKECVSWKNVDELLDMQELFLAFIISASGCGVVSLMFSYAATTSRVAIFVTNVVALEITSAVLGVTVGVLYASKLLYNPWKAYISYYLLWLASILQTCAVVIHVVQGDVKLFGKKFFVSPTPAYKYNKAASTIEEIT